MSDDTSKCVFAGIGAFAGWCPHHTTPECLALTVQPLTRRDELAAANPTDSAASIVYLHHAAVPWGEEHYAAGDVPHMHRAACVMWSVLYDDMCAAPCRTLLLALSKCDERAVAAAAAAVKAASDVPVGLAMCARAMRGKPMQWLSGPPGVPDQLCQLLTACRVPVDASVLDALGPAAPKTAAAAAPAPAPAPSAHATAAAVAAHDRGALSAVDLDRAFICSIGGAAPPLPRAGVPPRRRMCASARTAAAAAAASASGADVLSYIEAAEEDRQADICFIDSTALAVLPVALPGTGGGATRVPLALRDLRTLPPARALALLHNLLLKLEDDTPCRALLASGKAMQAVCTLFGAAVDGSRGANWVFDGEAWRANAPDAFVPTVRRVFGAGGGGGAGAGASPITTDTANLRCAEPSFLATPIAAVWWWLLWRACHRGSMPAALLGNLCALCELSVRLPVLGLVPVWAAFGAVLTDALGAATVLGSRAPLPPAAPYVPWMRRAEEGTVAMAEYVRAMATGVPNMMNRRHATMLARVAAAHRNTLQAQLATRSQLCASTLFSFQTGQF